MSAPKEKVALVRRIPGQDLFTATPEKIQSTHTDELVIALCGPIGSPLHAVAEELSRVLTQTYAYECKVIKLSSIIEEYCGNAVAQPRFQRVSQLIDKGNTLRKDKGNSVLAELAVHKISIERETAKGDKKSYPPRRICHIIDSIKNDEELEALRLVYRDMLYFVGVFAPMSVRETNLEKLGMSLAEVYQLIDRDSGEETDYGQTVRDTFPRADFFVRVGVESDKRLTDKLTRFLNLILGVGIETPSPDETAMYMAASAAGNSACLSRQVGAAITNSTGRIISVGWNDVPRYGGGLYQYDPLNDPAMERDKRCMNYGGRCYNDDEKDKLSKVIVDALVVGEIIKEEARAADPT